MTGRAVAAGLLGAVAVGSAALAAGGGGHEASLGDLLFPTINFVLFLWLVTRLFGPGVRRVVRERHDTVVAALREATRAQEEAGQLRREWEARLAQLEDTVADIRRKAIADAERERERILAAAQAAAEAIRRDAERAAAYEVRRMRQALRAELVGRAVSLAEGAVRTQWGAADQQRAVDEFLAQVRA